MQMLKAAYLNELYKISKKKKIVVAAVLSIASVVLAGLIVAGVNNFMGIKVTGTSEFSILVLSVLNCTLIPLFTLFVCIDMFTGEFVDHTIKQTLTRPVSRIKVFSSKVLAAATFILADLLFVMIVSLAVSFAIQGMSLSVGKVFVAYLTSFLPLFVFALFVIVVANITKGTASAFLISVFAFLVFSGLGMVFGHYQSFFFTSMFDWYTLFIGSYVNWHKILRVLLILCGCGMMFFAGGYYLFDKKDI